MQTRTEPNRTEPRTGPFVKREPNTRLLHWIIDNFSIIHLTIATICCHCPGQLVCAIANLVFISFLPPPVAQTNVAGAAAVSLPRGLPWRSAPLWARPAAAPRRAQPAAEAAAQHRRESKAQCPPAAASREKGSQQERLLQRAEAPGHGLRREQPPDRPRCELH